MSERRIGPERRIGAGWRIGAGRWLAWLAYLLIASGLFRLLEYGQVMLQERGDPEVLSHIFRFIAPLIAVNICTVLTGLALLFWRRPAGFYAAFLLIWLVPVVLICDWLLAMDKGLRLDAAASHLLFIILRSGVFCASGCSAFLLGVPGIQQAYGLSPGEDDGGAAQSESDMAQPSWLGLLCAFMLLPVLSLVPVIGNGFTTPQAYWSGTETVRQAICLAFALPLLASGLLLMKYRHVFGRRLVITLLWLMPCAELLWLVPDSAGSAEAWAYASQLPRAFGFGITAAFAWTAYLLTAPLVWRGKYGA